MVHVDIFSRILKMLLLGVQKFLGFKRLLDIHIFCSTVQPHYNAIFGVHRSKPCYKRNRVIMRLHTIDI